MKDKFCGYIPYNEEEFKELWEDSIIVLDANILLNLYRYSESTQKVIIEDIEYLRDRLWIPYNTAEEFFKNRMKVIHEQKKIYNEIKNKISFNSQKEFIKQIRHITLDSKKDNIILILQECEDRIYEILDEDMKNNTDDDNVIYKVLELYDGKIGERLSEEKIKEYKKEIDKRYENNIPPGYKDIGRKTTDRKYGDAINWLEIIKYAKENERNVIYITDDNKEDWFYRIDGKTYGPRMELLQEFYEKTEGKKIYIYNTSTFIENFNNYFHRNENISNEIDEIEEVRKFYGGSLWEQLKENDIYIDQNNKLIYPFKMYDIDSDEGIIYNTHIDDSTTYYNELFNYYIMKNKLHKIDKSKILKFKKEFKKLMDQNDEENKEDEEDKDDK